MSELSLKRCGRYIGAAVGGQLVSVYGRSHGADYIHHDGRPTHVYLLTDFDPSGGARRSDRRPGSLRDKRSDTLGGVGMVGRGV